MNEEKINIDEIISAGEYAMQQEKWADALVLMNKALRKAPSHIHALYYKAQILDNLDRFKEALNTYDELLTRLDSNSETAAEVTISKGCTLLELGELEKADRCFDYSLQIMPRLARAWVHKSRVAARKKNFIKSAKYCDHAIALNPEDPRAWNNKAYALLELNEPNESIQCAQKAVELNPSYFMAWHWMAKGYEKIGKQREAEKAIQKFQMYQQVGVPLHSIGMKPVNPPLIKRKKWWWPF